MVAFARLGNSEMLGQYAFALAVTAPVFMFFNMRLRFVVATDLVSGASFSSYFRFRLISSLAAAAIIAIGTFSAIGTPELIAAVLVMSLVRLVESLSDLIYGLYQRSHNVQLMAASMALSGIGMLAATVCTLILGMPVGMVVLAMLVARILVLFLFDQVQWRRRWPEESSRQAMEASRPSPLRSILVRCWPLGIVAFLVSLNTNIPRYFVEYFLDSRALGVFAALAYVPIAGYMIVGTMGQAVMPDLARAFRDENTRNIIRGIALLGGFGAAAGLAAVVFGVFFGEKFLRLAYGSDYAEYSSLFTVLLAAGAISYIVVGAVYSLTAAGRFKWQLAIYATDLVAVSVLCVLLMPGMGLHGGGIAILASQAVQLLIAAVLTGAAVRGMGIGSSLSTDRRQT